MIKNLEEIKRRLDPVAVLNFIGYAKSKPHQSDDEIRDFCPIHEGDNQKSLAISQTEKTFFCHSCGASGDLIDLYKQAKQIDRFSDAVENLASHFYINVVREKKEKLTTKKPSISADEVWASAKEGEGHPYLMRKGVNPCQGLRYGEDLRGNDSIIVPFYNVNGHLQTVQFINNNKPPAKNKFFLQNHPFMGAFFKIGSFEDGDTVHLAEGLATTLTIKEEIQGAAISFGSAYNMVRVVNSLKGKYSNLKIIICLDDNKAALDEAQKISKRGVSFRKPSFEGLQREEGDNDFNDLKRLAGAVKDQLQAEFVLPSSDDNKSENTEPEYKPESFYDSLGAIIGDLDFALQQKNRNYELFEQEHKKLFAAGGLITGYEQIDEQLYFAKGDFVVVQALSNHGKSTFMLQLLYRFLTDPKNTDKNPLCIFITYESMSLRIEEKLINLIGNENGNGTPVLYNWKREEKYLYAEKKEHRETVKTFDDFHSQNNLFILPRAPLESLESLIRLYKETYSDKTLILFLDYMQIIDTKSRAEGWERIKEISYKLEALAIKNEIVIISASQVNEKRQTREGRDIYNAATTVLDIFNHSHASLKSNEDLSKLYHEPINGKNICTFSAFKQKHGSSFDLPNYFMFNGYNFERNQISETKDFQF